MPERLALLGALLGHERERLRTWARPLDAPEKQRHAGVAAGAWREHTRTAWATTPVLALNLLDRCGLPMSCCPVLLEDPELRPLPPAVPRVDTWPMRVLHVQQGHCA